jgi:DNA (cytosine-5)-methyltransferase 1
MDPRKLIEEIYSQSNTIDDIKFDKELHGHLLVIRDNIENRKGVYCVLITLCIYKLLHPEQDIRLHQDWMDRGFSGRSFDTKYISPFLNINDLPSNSETGWLTRSLEQPHPYNFNYPGKISKVKPSFLYVVDQIQNSKPKLIKYIVRYLFYSGIIVRNTKTGLSKSISITTGPSIDTIMEVLNIYFSSNYGVQNGSKLPVICFHSIYSLLVNELDRYEDCKLMGLKSHTSSDTKSKTSGDIEVVDKNGLLFESVEIKYDKVIDVGIISSVSKKIIQHKPTRYYILSTKGISKKDEISIMRTVQDMKDQFGCELIINGIIPSVKYYLRLINNPVNFINVFNTKIINDKELHSRHIIKWKELFEQYFV